MNNTLDEAPQSSLVRMLSVAKQLQKHCNASMNNIADRNNNNSNIEKVVVEEEQHFHPIACQNCRQVHKHCDKRLPSCTSCLTKGQPCIYTVPKRNPKNRQAEKKRANLSTPVIPVIKGGRTYTSSSSERNQNYRFQPYPTVNQSSSPSSQTYSSPEINEFLQKFGEKNRNKPIVRYVKQNLELTLAFMREETLSLYKIIVHPKLPIGVFDTLITSPNPTIEGKALLYAIYSNIEQRLGAPVDRQTDFIESAKTLLGLVSYDRSNVRVILAQYFLSDSLVNHGKFKDALFYLNQMNLAIDEYKSKSTELEYEEKSLIKINDFAKHEITHAIEVDSENIFQDRSFRDFFAIQLSKMQVNYLPSVDVLFPLNSMTKENIPIHLQTIERAASVMAMYLKSYCKDVPFKFMADVMSLLCKTLMKILCVRDIDNMQFGLIVSLCDEMIRITDSQYFNLLPSKIIHGVTVSTKEILRIIKCFQTFKVTDMKCANIDLYELLQKHLTVIKKLAAKYKRVEIFYSNLIKEIEMTLESKLQYTSDSNNYSNNEAVAISSISSSFELPANSLETSNNNLDETIMGSVLFDVPEVDALLKEISN